MCLLETVLEYDREHIHCETGSHRDPDNPLRRDDRLSALHLTEYAAQAMAAHGALQSDGRPQPGMLAALRDIRLHVEHLDDIQADLSVRARRRLAQREGSIYEFSVSAGGRMICEGRISIVRG
jgi:predicted hotdog family 3-hydroxylacyl-ACP dehydratase